MSRSRIITIAVVAVAVIAAVVVAFLLTRPDEATPPEAEMGQVRPVDPARGAAIPEAPFMVIPDELVVLLKEGEDVESFTASLAEEGVTVVGYVPRFRVVQIAVPAERREALRAELANNPTVEAIAHQLLFEAKAALDDPVFTNDDPWDDWGLQAIGAPAAWDITRGSPDVVIAVVDTGMLLSHEEIWAKVIVRPGSVYSEVGAHLGDAEELFHGTHVAVLAVGAGDNGVGTAGVCPDCALMPVQVDLSLSGILAGIAYALDGGAQVINLSLGVDFSEDEIDGFMDPARRDAVIALLEQVREEYLADFDERLAASFASGTTIVVAAGNDAVPGDFDPFCASTFTLCVGNAARREDGTIAPSPTSNYGFMVRVSAPGTDMYSAVAEIGGESYELASGTSMAAPMVAGLAGLILSANPDLAPWEVQEAIMASAHAAAPDSGQGGPPLYATAREPAHELGAWRRAFLRLVGKDDALLLDNPAQSFVLWHVPGPLNRVWDQPQRARPEAAPATARADQLVCAAREWTEETYLGALYGDDCARAIGRFVDAPTALEIAASRAYESRFARFSDDDIARAEALDPRQVVQVADMMRAEGRYVGTDAVGGPFTLDVAPPYDRIGINRASPPGEGYEEWLEFVLPGRYRHHARLGGEDYSQGPVDIWANAAGMVIRNLLRQEDAAYRRE